MSLIEIYLNFLLRKFYSVLRFLSLFILYAFLTASLKYYNSDINFEITLISDSDSDSDSDFDSGINSIDFTYKLS